MNKIEKNSQVPDILLTRGEQLKRELIEQADREESKFSFYSEVYAHSTVKECLELDQYNKCAYCERYRNGDFGDVEHFRPKNGYQQSSKTPINKPGYYWLAYDWDNMLLSCSECNRVFKKNLFPLRDERKRGVSCRNIEDEEPLLINPVSDNPAQYICFEAHVIKAITINETESIKGKMTIDVFKLNDREDLVESRRRKWNEYQDRIKTISVIRLVLNIGIMDDHANELREVLLLQQNSLKDILSDKSEFAGMFKYQKDKI